MPIRVDQNILFFQRHVLQEAVRIDISQCEARGPKKGTGICKNNQVNIIYFEIFLNLDLTLAVFLTFLCLHNVGCHSADEVNGNLLVESVFEKLEKSNIFKAIFMGV